MCGIAGYVGAQTGDNSLLDDRMATAIRFRGRDAEGNWGEPGFVQLFHSRLKIVDPVSGAQPMQDDANRFVIVFNGEIYNYSQLRANYEKLGARFRTRSDTEILLAGYRLKGSDMLKELVGMFAFAIWDRERRTLFLARDHLGKKPLYWYAHADTFFFASTLDAFVNAPGWDGELSRTCLDFYSAVGSFPRGFTAFKRGRELPPGCYAIVRSGKPPVVDRYWQVKFGNERKQDLATAQEEYEAILTNAIKIRLPIDMPAALTFSGGVDSGTIAAIAARKLG